MTRNQRQMLVKSNETVKALKEVCEKYGYYCDYSYIASYWKPYVSICPLDRDWYYPDVRLNVPFGEEWRNSKNWNWTLNAACYGSMDLRKYDLFLHHLTQAKKLVEELVDIDLTKLPVEPEDFED